MKKRLFLVISLGVMLSACSMNKDTPLMEAIKKSEAGTKQLQAAYKDFLTLENFQTDPNIARTAKYHLYQIELGKSTGNYNPQKASQTLKELCQIPTSKPDTFNQLCNQNGFTN
ncbi:hypothetical protein A4G18_08985 [Pasteurellaceae bacterium Pebbles2]|nr:hypothetical protein [Pasteurellaceae bacterium Pebbles2]